MASGGSEAMSASIKRVDSSKRCLRDEVEDWNTTFALLGPFIAFVLGWALDICGMYMCVYGYGCACIIVRFWCNLSPWLIALGWTGSLYGLSWFHLAYLNLLLDCVLLRGGSDFRPSSPAVLLPLFPQTSPLTGGMGFIPAILNVKSGKHG